MNIQRPYQITFRLSDKEVKQLRSNILLSGCNQQEYLRKVALKKNIVNTDGIKEILPEMKKQGANLNQIAKKLNEKGYVDYGGILEKSLREVGNTWQLLRRYLAMHR